MELIIDNEFSALIPNLTEDELQLLKENIKTEGIRDALVTWNNIIIDGHNRYAIAQELKIKFKIIEMQFENRSFVKEWIIRNQFGRRNLNIYQRTVLALKLREEIASRAKERLKTSTGGLKPRPLPKSAKAANGSKNTVHTRNALAKIAGVSHDTVDKVIKIQAKADKKIIEQLTKGEITVGSAFRTIVQPEEKDRARKTKSLTKKRLNELVDKLNKVIEMLDVPCNSHAPVTFARTQLIEIKNQLTILKPIR